MGLLSGKVALVTGASRGIGADVARMLAAEGARVVCCSRTEHEGQHPLEGSLDATVADIRAAGGEALAVRANLALDEDCERVVGSARAAFGPVDVLRGVGVAAIAPSLIVPTPGALANAQITGADDPRAEDPAYMTAAIRALVTDPLERMAGRVVYSQQLLLEKGLIEGGAGLGVDPERRVTGYVSASVPRA